MSDGGKFADCKPILLPSAARFSAMNKRSTSLWFGARKNAPARRFARPPSMRRTASLMPEAVEGGALSDRKLVGPLVDKPSHPDSVTALGAPPYMLGSLPNSDSGTRVRIR